ncbi:MAG: glycosyltransferase family 2 protein [Pseudomonadota bacterium]
MKVIIQVPCYNEEECLAETVRDLPRCLPGVDTVEWMIIDDGSTDRTAEIARSLGVHHIIRHPKNRGLAQAFMTGLNASLDRGADIIVTTDADNQYYAGDIPKLIAPILKGAAEIVVGARPIKNIVHFSVLKKMLQIAGSWVVRLASKTKVADAPSGFRAISRSAAMKLHVFDNYTYTLETIIQAGRKDIPLVSVPVRVNKNMRPSRLAKGIHSHFVQSMKTVVRIFMIYRPFRFFLFLGAIPFSAGLLICMRFLWNCMVMGSCAGKVQSLIFGSLLMGFGFLLFILALLADLISVNRQLLEKIDGRVHQLEKTGVLACADQTESKQQYIFNKNRATIVVNQ